MGNGMSNVSLTWRRHPQAILTGHMITADGAGSEYKLRWSTQPRVYVHLSTVESREDALKFVQQYGFLVADRTRLDARIVMAEARSLREALTIWQSLGEGRTLKSFERRANGWQALRRLVFGPDEDFEREWKEWRESGSEAVSLFAPFLLHYVIRVRLRSVGLRLVSQAIPDFLASTGGARASHVERARTNPFMDAPWVFAFQPFDLQTFVWLEFALDMAGGKTVSLCPYCGEFYLVKRRGVQTSCGKPRCKMARHRSPVIRLKGGKRGRRRLRSMRRPHGSSAGGLHQGGNANGHQYAQEPGAVIRNEKATRPKRR